MTVSPQVALYLETLEQAGARPLERRDDFALLCEAAFAGGKERNLDEVAFLGKFAVRSLGIMGRIGAEGAGYDRFAAEFAAALETIRRECGVLLEELPVAERERISERYFTLRPGALQELLLLLQDASRHKNWLIDHPGQLPWPPRISR
jgi:hypothetical protein